MGIPNQKIWVPNPGIFFLFFIDFSTPCTNLPKRQESLFLSYAEQKVTYEFSAQYLHVCGYGKPSNCTTVIEAKEQKVGPDRECPKQPSITSD